MTQSIENCSSVRARGVGPQKCGDGNCIVVEVAVGGAVGQRGRRNMISEALMVCSKSC
jgi:hypothetical protein